MPHWTDAQRWRELNTHEVITAGELLARHGDELRRYRVSLVDAPAGNGVRLQNGEVWYRYSDAPRFGSDVPAKELAR